MKKLTGIFLTLIIIVMSTACGQRQIKIPNMTKFEDFKNKTKFTEDTSIFYPGIADKTLLPVLNEKINLLADDFKNLAEKGNANDKAYQDKIEKGLKRFSGIYIQLDTEDRERVCNYIEELMDIVGLESSGGHLNMFVYGFDPTKK